MNKKHFHEIIKRYLTNYEPIKKLHSKHLMHVICIIYDKVIFKFSQSQRCLNYVVHREYDILGTSGERPLVKRLGFLAHKC